MSEFVKFEDRPLVERLTVIADTTLHATFPDSQVAKEQAAVREAVAVLQQPKDTKATLETTKTLLEELRPDDAAAALTQLIRVFVDRFTDKEALERCGKIYENHPIIRELWVLNHWAADQGEMIRLAREVARKHTAKDKVNS